MSRVVIQHVTLNYLYCYKNLLIPIQRFFTSKTIILNSCMGGIIEKLLLPRYSILSNYLGFRKTTTLRLHYIGFKGSIVNLKELHFI